MNMDEHSWTWMNIGTEDDKLTSAWHILSQALNQLGGEWPGNSRRVIFCWKLCINMKRNQLGQKVEQRMAHGLMGCSIQFLFCSSFSDVLAKAPKAAVSGRLTVPCTYLTHFTLEELRDRKYLVWDRIDACSTTFIFIICITIVNPWSLMFLVLNFKSNAENRIATEYRAK